MGYCYVLLCTDGSYYTGSTQNVTRRLSQHRNGHVKYTKSRRPVEVIFVKEFDTIGQAIIFERKIKSWKKRKSIERMIGKKDNIVAKYIQAPSSNG